MRTVLAVIGYLLLLGAAGFLYMATETNRYWDERTR